MFLPWPFCTAPQTGEAEAWWELALGTGGDREFSEQVDAERTSLCEGVWVLNIVPGYKNRTE